MGGRLESPGRKTRWYLLAALLPLFLATLADGFPASRLQLLAAGRALVYGPFIVFFVAALLAGQLHQTRVFAASLLLGFLYWFLRYPQSLPVPGLSGPVPVQILSLAVPLSLAVNFSLRENTLRDALGLDRAVLTLSPALFLWATAWAAPERFKKIMEWDPVRFGDLFLLPAACVLSLLGLVLTVTLLKEKRLKPLMTGTALSMIPLYGVMERQLAPFGGTPLAPALTVLSFCSISGILLHSVVSLYWARVYLDELTGIPNRGALEEHFQGLKGDYAVAMVDIDHFKKFNDQYGHDQGDHVLRLVAQHLAHEFGPGAFRYGGEEFCAVFRDADPKKVFQLADRMRQRLEKRPFRLRRPDQRGHGGTGGKTTHRGKAVQVTVSVGLAFAGKGRETPHEVLKRADQALYQAKEKGRNQVVAVQ